MFFFKKEIEKDIPQIIFCKHVFLNSYTFYIWLCENKQNPNNFFHQCLHGCTTPRFFFSLVDKKSERQKDLEKEIEEKIEQYSSTSSVVDGAQISPCGCVLYLVNCLPVAELLILWRT